MAGTNKAGRSIAAGGQRDTATALPGGAERFPDAISQRSLRSPWREELHEDPVSRGEARERPVEGLGGHLQCKGIGPTLAASIAEIAPLAAGGGGGGPDEGEKG